MQNKKIENKLTSEDMELIRNDSTFEQKKKRKKRINGQISRRWKSETCTLPMVKTKC